MSRRWSKATIFVEHPEVPLDNNGAERAIRGPVVGRKNHYGSRSRRGTEVAAVFYVTVRGSA
jgi:transposase